MRQSLPFVVIPLIFACSAHAQNPARYLPVSIPVRDGSVLAADVYTTDTLVKKPVVLVQTPYNKNAYRLTLGLPPSGDRSFPYDSTHYAYVILDWRGFYGSKAANSPGYDRGLDGFDAVEWIAAQPWCDGNVATWGPSALGLIQYQTARHHPPHLVCCVPLVKDFKTQYGGYYCGGDFRKEHVETLEKLGFLTTSAILSHPTLDAVWRAAEAATDWAKDVNVPVLVIGGWFDHFPDDVLRSFDDLLSASDPPVRAAHQLVMGPWTHGGVDDTVQGELSYPAGAGVARDAAMAFLDFHLRGIPLPPEHRPAVRYFQLGEDAWHAAPRWPGIPTSEVRLYLSSDSSLLSSQGSGIPAFREIVSNPRDPSPSVGGARFNPFDPSAVPGPMDIRAAVESRRDALIYSTAPLERPLVLDGPAEADLWISSDRLDADAAVRFCDVYPDGRSMIMADGILRLRFRNSLSQTELMTPGEPVRITVPLQQLALTVLRGHRLRLVITGSNAPRFDVNLCNGGPMYTGGDTLSASLRVYDDPQHPSAFVLRAFTGGTGGIGHTDRPSDPAIVSIAPNPAASPIRIRVHVPATAATRDVVLLICDALGRPVSILHHGPLSSGDHVVSFDGRHLASGLYYCMLKTDGTDRSAPFVLVR